MSASTSLYTFTVKEFGAQSSPIIFFFAGMGTRINFYRIPIKRMVDAGFRVIAFDFEPGVVRNGEPEAWLELGEKVSDAAGTYIRKAKSKGVTSFGCFGVSMGTLMAIRCAADYHEIKKVVLNLTYGSVAENVWTWKVIKPAKLRAQQLGYSLEELDKKLAPISPIPQAPKLKNKQVLLYLAKRDKILLYSQAKMTKKAFEDAGLDLQYYENRYLGHITSAYLNLRRYNVWLDFLKA